MTEGILCLLLLDCGEDTMYLLDHADKEGIENRNPK